ncbi:MAG TPA: DUF1549 domain-containing protein, partial [Pirellulales bacterium]|nr:DUF1549 domain-containing protein [Pirellulales bacterium]
MLRNIVFLATCAVGLMALAAALDPRVESHGRNAISTDGKAIAENLGLDEIVAQLDRAFASEWARRGLQAASAADELTVVRRLALALMGTIPSIEEIRRLESVPANQRVARYLANVLNDRRFHDYFAERLARPLVGVKDGVFIVYRRSRFVSWLSEQLRDQRPYDEMVRELITADGQGTDRPPVNFILAAMTPGMRPLTPDCKELASRVSRAMLGVRIDCAQCHDHPFDSWKQTDFHGLAAFFAGAKHSFAGIHEQPAPYEYENHALGRTETIEPQVPFNPDQVPAHLPPRERLAAWITDPANERFGLATVNRVWALMFGRGLVEPIDDLRLDASLPPALVLLGRDFREQGYDLRRLISIIASSRVFHLDSRLENDPVSPAEHELAWAVFPLSRLRPEQVVGSLEQSASVQTYDDGTNVLLRFAKYAETNDFLKRYGDLGDDELADRGGTIPQRLLLMNGKLVKNKTRGGPAGPLLIAATQIALF